MTNRKDPLQFECSWVQGAYLVFEQNNSVIGVDVKEGSARINKVAAYSPILLSQNESGIFKSRRLNLFNQFRLAGFFSTIEVNVKVTLMRCRICFLSGKRLLEIVDSVETE